MNELDTQKFASVRAVDAAALRERVEHHLVFSFGKDREAARLSDWRLALTRTIRDEIVVPWFAATKRTYAEDHKRVYYLSMEFLIGRLLHDATVNLGLEESARDAMAALGTDYDALVADEPDAALGNGGLGRLAACFLDSMSSIGIAAYGYGIRYDHGLFKQGFDDGWQTEEAEDWLSEAHAWEFERPEASIPIFYGGKVAPKKGDAATWEPADTVIAAAYDTPIAGWRGRWVNTLRLWAAKPTREFELGAFNRGDYLAAAAPAVLAQTISRVLYPDDSTPEGRKLRLRQEYFFTAASLSDILRRYQSKGGDLRALPQKVAIQLNDTHPAIAGPELVRLLVDGHGMTFDEAFTIAQQTLNYTNHTLMPEALERWSYDLMAEVLPRHVALIERIDERHAKDCAARGKTAGKGVRAMGEGEVRMGNLAFIMAHRVNGVSALHTKLVKETVFRELHELHPDRVVNETNGVTPRRWLYSCNPLLRNLLTETIGDRWTEDLAALSDLAPHAEDRAFQDAYRAVKQANKEKLVGWIKERCGIEVDPSAMFDVQIKRIHEYKRQLLNVLETVALYYEMKRNPDADWTPRVKIFGGKAAPGYAMAKLIIKFANDVAAVVNADETLRGRLKIAFPANYNVSAAEWLIPATDLSEQISTAGMEASGTGNMKFALNGALTVGTLDGANVEIAERVGLDNIFIFGLTAEGVAGLRGSYRPEQFIKKSARLTKVLAEIERGAFSPDDPSRFKALVDDLRGHDWFMLCADFDAYYEAQRRVDEAWKDDSAWTKSAILNTAHCGWFSSDRTIRGYARDVWHAEPAL
ncbi:MAG: glycogen/starch/alpha-glucan phosphorylase [Pseudomonadota bacterium]